MPRQPHNSIFAFAGPWYGNFCQVLTNITEFHEDHPEVTTIIQLGDLGFSHKKLPEILELDDLLGRYGMTLYFIDGSRDNFVDLYSYPKEGNLRHITDNIHYINRGSSWIWVSEDGPVRFTAMGGRATPDKDNYIPGETWFAQESITTDDVETALKYAYYNTDILITNDTPSIFSNETRDKYVRRNRSLLTELSQSLEPRYIIHPSTTEGYQTLHHIEQRDCVELGVPDITHKDKNFWVVDLNKENL